MLDVGRLRPDAARHQQVVVVGQVHEGREILAESDRVENGEAHLARRDARQQPIHHGLQRVHRLRTAGVLRQEQHRSTIRERANGRQGEVGHGFQPQGRAGVAAVVEGDQFRDLLLSDGDFTELQHGRRGGGRRPVGPARVGPRGEQPIASGSHGVHGRALLGDGPPPLVRHHLPAALVAALDLVQPPPTIRRQFLHLGVVSPPRLRQLAFVFTVERSGSRFPAAARPPSCAPCKRPAPSAAPHRAASWPPSIPAAPPTGRACTRAGAAS